MFMEMGFLNGLYDSQTGALRIFDADLVMLSSGLHIFNTHDTFHRARLEQVAGFRGVRSVAPIYIEDRRSTLRNPQTGIEYVIRAIAVDVGKGAFATPALQRLAADLRQPLTILFDEESRPFFGTLRRGMATELGTRVVTVTGTFKLGPDYYYDGNVLLSSDTFFTIFPHQSRDNVVLGLISLTPGASPATVLRELRETLSSDVEVMTKRDLIAREKATWQKATPAGYIFSMGVAVGFVIGVFICYQILFTYIADHVAQFATLKALGYDDRYVVRLVLTQAVLLGVAGFIPALISTFGLYSVLTALTGIVTQLTFARTVTVFCLTLGMCLVAGRLAVRKALAADPANLF
jgi:putative ABC transport system permease protein